MGYSLLFVFPVLSAHGALVLSLLGPQPLLDAMNVETVGTLPPDLEIVTIIITRISGECHDDTHQRTIVSGKLAVWAAAVESYSADAAGVVIGEPLPDRDPRPGADVDLESGLGSGLLSPRPEAAPVLVLLAEADLG